MNILKLSSQNTSELKTVSSNVSKKQSSSIATVPKPDLSTEQAIRTDRNLSFTQFSPVTEAPVAAATIKLNEEQIAKLNSELDIVDNNVLIMNEILTELHSLSYEKLSSSEKKKDIDLLKVNFLLIDVLNTYF